MSISVVYFSRYGNARFVAQAIAGRLEAELVELAETRQRKGVIGFLVRGLQASSGKSSELVGTPWEEVRGRDTLYLVTPIWAGNCTPAMNAFLDRADLTGALTHAVTLQADPDKKGSDRVHKYIHRRVEECGGRAGNAFGLHSAAPGDFAGEEHLRKQVASIVFAEAQ